MTRGYDRLLPSFEGIVKRRRIAAIDDFDDFGDAVRALRRTVRNLALTATLAILRRSERVLEAELERYREPQAARTRDRHAAPVANGRSKELFALFTAVAGAPRRILLPGEAQLSAKAGRLLAAGQPLGFLPRTRFAAAGPAEIAAWHPDHPDCLIRLDDSGITWYRRADGAVGRVDFPHTSTVDRRAAES